MRNTTVSTDPSNAMPSALPISLLVSAMAPAAPARDSGTAPTAVSATRLNEMPNPIPETSVDAM